MQNSQTASALTKQDSKSTVTATVQLVFDDVSYIRRCDFAQQLIVRRNIGVKVDARQFLEIVLCEKNSSH